MPDTIKTFLGMYELKLVFKVIQSYLFVPWHLQVSNTVSSITNVS